MKKSIFFALLLLLGMQGTNSLFAQNEQNATYTPSVENLKARAEFQDSKFGIFLHCGQHRAFCFLTGSRSQGWISVEENNRHLFFSGKGEKVE